MIFRESKTYEISASLKNSCLLFKCWLFTNKQDFLKKYSVYVLLNTNLCISFLSLGIVQKSMVDTHLSNKFNPCCTTT